MIKNVVKYKKNYNFLDCDFMQFYLLIFPREEIREGAWEKAKATLKSTELLTKFKDIENLPEKEQSVILEVISAYIRDYKAKQAYSS